MTRRTRILYAPLNWLLHLVAWLPWRALYGLADAIYFLVYHLIGYRRRVVRGNLAACFPEKDERERHAIERRFYRHFADYFVETLKLRHVSDDEMRRRMVFRNAQVIDDALAAGQSIVLYAAHYGNWEWITSVTLWLQSRGSDRQVLGQVYQPLENEWFNDFFLGLRHRFNTLCIKKHAIAREMLRGERDGRHLAIGFISDQHPWINDEGHVLEFLHQPTAFITGPELIARRLGCRAAYFDVRRVSRGHYECTLVPLSDDCSREPAGSITTRYARMLEQRITQEPEWWLWTHKRWKRPVTYPPGYSRDNEMDFYNTESALKSKFNGKNG